MAGHARTLLAQLLARGDCVAVEYGRLTISPASGSPVPADWMERHGRQLITEAARAAGVEALEYLGYSVGNYGPSKRGGVSLQFRNLVDGGERYSVFNAETRRNRNTKHGKKGGPLPRGQFRITERFKFYGFWLSTGLPVPRRLSAFHDYMGKLAGVVFTGTTTDGERVGDLCPLSLSHNDLARLVGVNTAPGAGEDTATGGDTLAVEIGAGQLPDNCRTSPGQAPDNCRTSPGQLPDNSRTSAPDKETAQSQQPRDLEPNQSTGAEKHGNTVIRERGYTGAPVPPEQQTNKEWLDEYMSAH